MQPPKARHLRELGRIAIWNTEKIIILIAMGVWLVNVSLLFEGSYLFTDHGGVSYGVFYGPGNITGIVRVSFFPFTSTDWTY